MYKNFMINLLHSTYRHFTITKSFSILKRFRHGREVKTYNQNYGKKI